MGSELQERFDAECARHRRISRLAAAILAYDDSGDAYRTGIAAALRHPEWAQAQLQDYLSSMPPDGRLAFLRVVDDFVRGCPVEVRDAPAF